MFRGVYKSIKTYREDVILYNLNGINLNKIRTMIKELQDANQQGKEVKSEIKQVDQNVEVWRYLISTDDELFCTCAYSIDYTVLKECIDHIYTILEYIYDIVDGYL